MPSENILETYAWLRAAGFMAPSKEFQIMSDPTRYDDCISDFDAADIASAWHSVMTWNDPGVAMYSVTSTGRVHSEEHRENLIAYIDSCMVGAEAADARGDEPVLTELHASNVEELEALKEWAKAYPIGKED